MFKDLGKIVVGAIILLFMIGCSSDGETTFYSALSKNNAQEVE